MLVCSSEEGSALVEKGSPLNDALRKIDAELSNVKKLWEEVEKGKVVYWKQQLHEVERKNELENSRLQKEWKASLEQIEILRLGNEKLRSKAKDNEKEFNALQQNLDVLNIENAKLKTKVMDKVKMVNFLYKRVNKVDELVHNHRKVSEQHQAENKVLKKKVEQMEQKFQKEIGVLKCQYKYSEKENKRLVYIDNQMKEYSSKIQILEEENERFHNTWKIKQESNNYKIKKLEQENQKLLSIINKEQMAAFQQEILTVVKENVQLDEKLKKGEEQKEEETDILLRPGKRELEQQNEELKQQLSRVSAAIVDLEACIKVELNAYERKMEDLEFMLMEERAKNDDTFPEDELDKT